MKKIVILLIIVLLLCMLNLMVGSVDIPADQVVRVLTGQEVEKASWAYIVMESRLPQMLTALLCGASLATSGLLLQTLFHNPLAGPSLLGITNGASAGVSIVMLLCGGVIGAGVDGMSVGGFFAIVIGALAGAMVVIMIIMSLASVVRSNLMLLIVGIMVGYLTSSLVSLLYFFASAENVHSYSLWGLGSFSDVTMAQMPWFAGASVLSMACALYLVKPLGIMQLGDRYAENLGVNIKLVRKMLLLTTGLLTAVATAFCGPVSFIGLAVPHIARLLTRSSNYTILVPATMLMGAVVAMACNLICVLPENMIIPINAVTLLFGAPVIIWIVVRGK